MFSLAVGIQHAASLHVGNLLGIRALLVLFRIVVRAVIRESTSTESGLLQNRHRSFYTKRGAINYSWVQTKAGDFFQYLLQAISDHIFDSGAHLQN